MSKLPLVAIVGRANVGKSSLFNRLVGERRAIVADEPGTTRDTVYATIEHAKRHFLLADTAGLKTRPNDEFEMSIQDQITDASAAADVILVVVEAATLLTEEDRRVIKTALQSTKPTLLIANKVDQAKSKDDLAQWQRTGIRDVVGTSATQGTGVAELLDHINQHLPGKTPRPDTTDLTVALIGRPNVGKSSLYNALAQKQQALVSEQAGTTRDTNRFNLRYHSKTITILDTAGIRRPGRIARGVEQFSVLRAISAISEADICLLLIDVNEPATHLEQKLAGMIKEAGKGLIIVITKWDSAEKDAYSADMISKRIMIDFQHTWWAPMIFTSSLTGQNVATLLELITEIAERRDQKIRTPELNRLLQQTSDQHPPAGLKNRHPRLRYITQSDTRPPAFRVFGTQTGFLHWSYKRHLEKVMRTTYDFVGTPIMFYFSDRKSVDTKERES